MKNQLYLGGGIVALLLAAWLYYIHPAKVPPAPKDLTRVLPKPLLDKANAAQLAVLRGEATFAPKTANTATRAATDANIPAGTAAPSLADPAGLQVTLTTDKQGLLKGQAVNTSAQIAVYTRAAGTLFSNGTGDVVLLREVSVEVPAKGTANLELPVAQTIIGQGLLEGRFTPRAGTMGDTFQPLIELLAHKHNVTPAVAQTAVLIVNDDVPLDIISSFPRLRPVALSNMGDKPFSVPPADLVTALRLIQEAGIDPVKTSMMSEPQLKVMTMLNPDSHAAAMEFYGFSETTQWDFWKHQLLEGDPALRHYALYGIASYYPDVALEMLPRWVREPGVYRSYRISAAWALSLIDDARARQELEGLRQDLQSDAGLRQAIDRALQHWAAGNGKAARGRHTADNPGAKDPNNHAG